MQRTFPAPPAVRGLRRAVPLALAAGAAGLCPPPLSAIDIPAREILIGRDARSSLEIRSRFEETFVRLSGSYGDLYHYRSRSEYQDYHRWDLEALCLMKAGSIEYGIEAWRSSLSLAQDNAYTTADRMRGGRERAGASIVAGVESARRIPLVRPTGVRLVGSLGWSSAPAAAASGELRWGERAALSLFAETAPAEIRIAEEMNGHRFPFAFGFRADRARGELRAAAGAYRFSLRGGWEENHGAGGGEKGFENAVYVTRSSAGAGVSRGVRCAGAGEACPRKQDPSSPLPGFLLSFDRHESDWWIGMDFDGVRYLRLDDLHVDETRLTLRIVPFAASWITLGWERYSAGHDGDSFFDAWPFNIWDIFEARRYRLGPVDERIDVWSVGVGTHRERGRLSVGIDGRWEWLADEGALRWLEREDILFPFFFRYVPHDERLDLRSRYAVQIDPSLSVRLTDAISLGGSFRIAVPFGENNADSSPPSPPSPRQAEERPSRHGGIAGSVSIIYSL